MRQLRDAMRRLLEDDAARLELTRAPLNVVDRIVENRVELPARRLAFLLGRRHHQPHAAAVEERHARRRLEEKTDAEHVPVERHRAGKVPHRDRDLTDPRQPDAASYCRHRTPPVMTPGCRRPLPCYIS